MAMITGSNRTLLYGEGLFETILWNGRTRKLGRHYERLRCSARFLGIPCPDGDEFLRLIETRCKARRGIYLKFCLLSFGDSFFSAPPASYRTLIITKRLPAAQRPAELMISSLRRHSQDPLCLHKTMNYTFNILVRREALSQGCSDALILNERGEVTECSASNILLLSKGTLHTPARECGLLEGTTLRCLRDRFGVSSSALSVKDVRDADAVFLTNSIAGVLPVRRLADREFQADEALLAELRGAVADENGPGA